MPRNRRRHSRIKKRLKVEFGDHGLEHRGIIQDISIGGVFVASSRVFRVNTRLHLHVIDLRGDFYAEGVVVRTKRVDQHLRRIEAQGMGLRLMSPAEVIRSMVPKVARTVETRQLVCRDAQQLRRLLDEQLTAGVLAVPVGDAPPPPNTQVEFVIRLEFGRSQHDVAGEGRVLQLLEHGERKQAVLEVNDAAGLRARLEQAAAP